MAETGTNAGFHVIAEARDYLIQVSYTHIDLIIYFPFKRCRKYLRLRMRTPEVTASPPVPMSHHVLDTHMTQSPAIFLLGQSPDEVILMAMFINVYNSGTKTLIFQS